MSHITRMFTVHGRVQGVWFRESTRREAERLGISGHAINCPDGTVEVVASGPGAALEELEAWLHTGPPMAQVLRVEARDTEALTRPGFRTG